MKNTKNIALTMAAFTAVILGSSSASAQSVGAQIIVANNFSITQTTPMSFGTIAIVNDGDNSGGTAGTMSMTAATPAVLSASARNAGDATVDYIRPLGTTTPTAGFYRISGAASAAVIAITLPTTVTLTCPDGTGSCTVNTPTLEIDNFTSSAAGGNVTTGTGASAGIATFYVGATLNTDPAADQVYDNGTYSGTFTITAAY